MTPLARHFTYAEAEGRFFNPARSPEKAGRQCSYYAWHKSQQMLESAPLASFIGF